MKKQHQVLVGDAMILREMKEARRLVEGSEQEQYGKL